MTILDAHIYAGESLFGQSQSIQQVLQSMDTCGIDQAVLIPNRPPQYDLWPANLWTAAQAALHPQRFFWAARVDPWQKQTALEQLARLHQEFDACGLLLHPWEELFQVSDALVDPLMEYCQQHGLWVMVEAGYPLLSHPLDIAELANRHPQVKIIATHGLQLDSAAFALTDAELAMRECPNLYMETSGMYAPENVENIVRDLGAERIIFGSHTPWLNQALELERVRCLNLDESQRQAVLGGNLLSMMQPRRM
jgi:predicted TIM-barrel fold metal-dependent hydrolase